MKFLSNKLVVLEGLDGTGKSVQAQLLASVQWEEAPPLVAHQPSGTSATSAEIYNITERCRELGTHPLTLQMLHMAAHVEHWDVDLLPALHDRGVVLDRFWWSTVAYGYFDGGLSTQFDIETFVRMASASAQTRWPDLILVFDKPYVEDPHNTHDVHQGYSFLRRSFASQSNDILCVPAWPGDPQSVHQWILMKLIDKGIVQLNTDELAALGNSQEQR